MGTTPPGVPIESYQFGGRVFIPIAGSFGELPGGSAEPVNQPYLVSTYTTYHPAGQDRNININLMADMVDGAVVGPGPIAMVVTVEIKKIDLETR